MSDKFQADGTISPFAVQLSASIAHRAMQKSVYSPKGTGPCKHGAAEGTPGLGLVL
ncbi:MAG: hypothetical protein P8Z30_05125 [Acidobacteriota bacterium]